MINGFEPVLAPVDEGFVDKLTQHFNDLKPGRKNAITNRSLRGHLALLHDPGGVKTRAAIHAIRVRGLVPRLICDFGGYWKAENDAEVQRYVDSLDQRVRSILEVKRALQQQLVRSVQGELFK